MKKNLYFIFLLAIILSSSSAMLAQNTEGKKASLNPDGSLQIDNIILSKEEADFRSDFQMLEGFPFGSPANPTFKNFRGGAIADLDGDGTQEFIFGAYSKLFALKGDGSILWMKTLSGTIIYPPSVADMDGDGIFEIIVNTGGSPNAGRVYLLDNQGNDLSGWPMNFEQHWMFNAPAISDLDGDGIMEVVTCERGTSTSGFLHAIKMDGTPLNANWPVELPGNLAFTPSLGDIDNNGSIDIVISISSGSLYALDLDGQVLPGFPLTDANKSFSYQSPILVDLDDDGTLEIVGSRHGNSPDYYVVKSDGTYMDGWPVESAGWRYSPPTVVDSDNDGSYEIYVGHPNTGTFPMNVIYGFNAQAENLEGFPISKVGGCEGVISVADVNDDGVQDIVFTSNITDAAGYGYIHAYSLDGSGEIEGFPLRPKGFTFINSAVLGDINNDGLMDLTCLSYTQFTGNDSIFISSYNLEVPYDANKVLANGYKGNNLRDGLLHETNVGISKITSNQMMMSLSPNPSSENLNLQFSQNITEGELVIYNVLGTAVKSYNIKNIMSLQLQLADLPSGEYLIQLQSEKFNLNEKWLKL